MRFWPFGKKKPAPSSSSEDQYNVPSLDHEFDSSLDPSNQGDPSSNDPISLEDSSLPAPLVPSEETSWLSAHTPQLPSQDSGQWVAYQFENDANAHTVPETQMVNVIPPPEHSLPPYDSNLDSDPYRMVFRTLMNEEVYEDSISDRALGPVWIPSLVEAASMYHRWVINHSHEAPQQAREMWEAYLEIKPDDLHASTQYAWLLYQFDGFQVAFEYLDQQFDYIADFEDVEQRKILLLSTLGSIAKHAQKWELAIRYFTDLNTLLVDDIHCLKTLVYLQQQAGYYEIARELEIQIREIQEGVWHGAQKN